MPYELVRVSGGWKVRKKGTKKTYSDKAQSYAKALAQMRAMYASEKKSK